jgi:phosphoribosylaminoimidazole carboxylase (NCAIR synthetase)
MKHTVKFWNTEKDSTLGNAEVVGEDLSEENADIVATALQMYGVYAVEIFETESGNTIFHSLD